MFAVFYLRAGGDVEEADIVGDDATSDDLKSIAVHFENVKMVNSLSDLSTLVVVHDTKFV